MSERPTQAEEATNGCSHASSIWSGDMKHGTCKTCGAKWDEEKKWHYEANSTHAQEVEEQEVLKLAEECNFIFGVKGNAVVYCDKKKIIKFATKLREQDAEMIAGLQAAARFWQDKAGEANETIAQQKEEIETWKQYQENSAIMCNELTEQLSATQAREAMLVEALKATYKDLEDNGSYDEILIEQALANSTEHTEKFLAEVRAKAFEHDINYAKEIAKFLHKHWYGEASPEFETLDSMSGVLSQIDNMVEGIRARSNELRGVE